MSYEAVREEAEESGIDVEGTYVTQAGKTRGEDVVVVPEKSDAWEGEDLGDEETNEPISETSQVDTSPGFEEAEEADRQAEQ